MRTERIRHYWAKATEFVEERGKCLRCRCRYAGVLPCYMVARHMEKQALVIRIRKAFVTVMSAPKEL